MNLPPYTITIYGDTETADQVVIIGYCERIRRPIVTLLPTRERLYPGTKGFRFKGDPFTLAIEYARGWYKIDPNGRAVIVNKNFLGGYIVPPA